MRLFRNWVWLLFSWILLLHVYSAESAGRDHPLFPRPSGYSLVERTAGEGAMVIPTERGDQVLNGARIDIFYQTGSSRPLSSQALGMRFLNALIRAGGHVVFSENPGLGGSRSIGKLVRNGRDVWVMQEVTSRRTYTLSVLETSNRRVNLQSPPFRDEVSERDAQVLDLLWSVERTGIVEFPLTFPQGETTPQRGFEQNMEKMARLMEKDPALKFLVLTYADTHLQPLPQRTQLRERTAFVIGALAAQGVDSARLAMFEGEETVPRGSVRFISVKNFDQ